jgi:hypothetical protein
MHVDPTFGEAEQAFSSSNNNINDVAPFDWPLYIG